MNPSTNPNDTASAITAIGALGIEAYQLSQGQPVSTTLGPGGAAVIQSGAAQTQTSIFLIVFGIVAALLLAYLFLK